MKNTISLLVFFFLLLSCGEEPRTLPITQWEPSKLQEGALLVDVRTPEEFEAGHLPGAVNIDFMAADFAEKWEEIPKDQTIYMYCKVGGRSARAAQLLDSLGYRNIIDLTGGYQAYQAAENP